MRQYQNAIRDVILRKLLNKHTKENSFTWNHDAVTSLTSRTNTGVDQGWRWRRDTRSREKDKYLLEQGFSPWSAIRAILTSPLLGRQKMPVSRCARLKNDRRGAKPGSTAPPLFLPLPLSFFLSFCFSLSSSISIPRCSVIPLPLSRCVLFASTLENRISLSSSLQTSEFLFFHGSFFRRSARSTRTRQIHSGIMFRAIIALEEHPRAPLHPPLPPFASFCVPSAPSMLLLIFELSIY